MKALDQREITAMQLQAIVAELAYFYQKHSSTKSCFVLGMGGQPKSTYTQLKNVSGVSVRWIYSCLPGFLFFLRFIPSYGGVVQIFDASRLNEVLTRVGDSGLVWICIFDSSRECDFLSLVKKLPHPENIRLWLKNIPGGVFYNLATDSFIDWLWIGDEVSSSSATGLEKVWHGKQP